MGEQDRRWRAGWEHIHKALYRIYWSENRDDDDVDDVRTFRGQRQDTKCVNDVEQMFK